MKQTVTNKPARRAQRLAIAAIALLTPALSAGCMHHAVRVEPITVAPVRVTMDVNLHVDDARHESTADAADAAAPATPAED